MERFIIHINVADFAVAVERVLSRRLAQRPVIVAPEGALRAAVYDMSEEAFQAGVRKGMPLKRALRLCPDAGVLPPHPHRYELAMADLLRRAGPLSPRIEPGQGDGHLFLDVTGTGRLLGPPVDVAFRLYKEIRRDLGLDPIWSVAPNKLIAKVATRLVKPVGEYIVDAGDEADFLAPLPIWLLPGIESRDLTRLREFNFTTVAQVSALSLPQLAVPFGKRARFLYETVRGIDPSPVLPAGQEPPKVMANHEFGNDTNQRHRIEGTLYRLVEEAGAVLRQQRRAVRRVAVILDYSDGVRCARQVTAKPATANDPILFGWARKALKLAWTRRVRIRHLRLVCDRLVFPPAQMALFPAEQRQQKRQDNLIVAMDAIRRRFGRRAIQAGRTLAA
jgi:DNA polymerase-4